ncbi:MULTISPECIES: hypothetical protein [Aneurinibacillus]|jgi:hypothetical protein|uniref:Uncharacterized protein n=3 Tax=Aneurinibacillus TaxID=55079 RepID=A0A0D1Y5A5_ANEMI|nr:MULTISPECIES: hypothetical protein [Aneurinibacillus]ERI05217.1 hypothetical protein HMPREF0083_05791 [Aneurinibacillus aneurinilyticus ATCC 12856]KIV59469.1 hypothetical protein TS64_01965 [Aneurinibacillus migulanus]KIV59548.1 hypothetical protein TS65_02380 [Aneurinibacillus migulanus]KON93077.1 hypothetical protein AF333_25715 [Aneurinibacillus migulanus]KPD07506.1 hypothetical protein AM501_14775 [Aneurinibacillus migulanus]
MAKQDIYRAVFEACLTKDDMHACYTGLVRCIIEEIDNDWESIREIRLVEHAYSLVKEKKFLG